MNEIKEQTYKIIKLAIQKITLLILLLKKSEISLCINYTLDYVNIYFLSFNQPHGDTVNKLSSLCL